jgi:thioredoxin 1
MKKLNIIILTLTAVLTFGCTSASNESAKEKAKSEIETNITGNVQPEHLTFDSFKEKVWDFESNPEEWVYKGTEPCIIDFYADWCKPCKMVAPIMEELAGDYNGKVKIYKIDTQTERKLASVFQITGIPAILFVPANGQPMKQTGAMSKDYYEQVIKDFLLPTPKGGNAASQK